MFVKSSDGPDDAWAQFNPTLVAALHAHGLRACAWQFVYGNDPLGEAAWAPTPSRPAPTASSSTPRAATRATTRRRSSTSPRCGPPSDPSYPIGLTSFPYVDYHPRLPYSVFLGPGGAQVEPAAGLLEGHRRDRSTRSARTRSAHNRIYGVPIAPLGQTYAAPRRRTSSASARCGRPTAPAGCRGGRGRRPARRRGPRWPSLPEPPSRSRTPAGRRSTRATRATRSSGCSSTSSPSSPPSAVDGTFGTSTSRRSELPDLARPAGHRRDRPATWQAVLALPVQPADWVSRGSGPRAAAAARRAPASANLPARREEIPPPRQRR